MRPSVLVFAVLIAAGTGRAQTVPAAGAHQLRLPTDVPLTGGTTLSFGTVEFNTVAGSTPGTAWQGGLHQISGGLTLQSTGASGAVVSVQINGLGVENARTSFLPLSNGQAELMFSVVNALNPGDQISLHVQPTNGFLTVRGGNYSQFTLTGFAPGAVDAKQYRLPGNQTVTAGAPLNFSVAELNTPGTAGTNAWQAGLYQISGGITAQSTNALNAEVRAAVNGVVIPAADSAHSRFRANGATQEVPFTFARLLNMNDAVSAHLVLENMFVQATALAGADSQLTMLRYNTVGGTPAAGVRQLRPVGAPQLITNSGIVTFGQVELNTAPGPGLPNQAWQTGLYQISGGISVQGAGPAGATAAEVVVLVNGVEVDRVATSFASPPFATNAELPFSFVRPLNAGDAVTVRVDATGGNGQLAIGPSPFTQLTLTGYNTVPVPEPGTVLGVSATLLGLGAWARRRSAR